MEQKKGRRRMGKHIYEEERISGESSTKREIERNMNRNGVDW